MTNLEIMFPERFRELQKSYPEKVLIEIKDKASNFYQILADKAGYAIVLLDKDKVQQIERIELKNLK